MRYDSATKKKQLDLLIQGEEKGCRLGNFKQAHKGAYRTYVTAVWLWRKGTRYTLTLHLNGFYTLIAVLRNADAFGIQGGD